MNTIAYEAYLKAATEYNEKGFKLTQAADLDKGVFLIKFQLPEIITLIRDDLIASIDGERLITDYHGLEAVNSIGSEDAVTQFKLMPRTRYKIKGAFVGFVNNRIASFVSEDNDSEAEIKELLTAILYVLYDTENTSKFELVVAMELRQHIAAAVSYIVDSFVMFFQAYMMQTHYEIKP